MAVYRLGAVVSHANRDALGVDELAHIVRMHAGHIGLYASNRASSGVYNSVEDAQALVEAAKGIRKFFGVE